VRIIRVASAAQPLSVRALPAVGHPFSAVASRYSLDTPSRAHRGLLLSVVRGPHARALDAAIFTAPALQAFVTTFDAKWTAPATCAPGRRPGSAHRVASRA
jgi:hypothetical protein